MQCKTLSASKCSMLSGVLNSLIVKLAQEKHFLEKADVAGGILKEVASNREVENLWTTISCD